MSRREKDRRRFKGNPESNFFLPSFHFSKPLSCSEIVGKPVITFADSFLRIPAKVANVKKLVVSKRKSHLTPEELHFSNTADPDSCGLILFTTPPLRNFKKKTSKEKEGKQ